MLAPGAGGRFAWQACIDLLLMFIFKSEYWQIASHTRLNAALDALLELK